MILAPKADWLIFDKPSAVLDMAGHLSALEEGKGVILALHDMNPAARICSRSGPEKWSPLLRRVECSAPVCWRICSM